MAPEITVVMAMLKIIAPMITMEYQGFFLIFHKILTVNSAGYSAKKETIKSIMAAIKRTMSLKYI